MGESITCSYSYFLIRVFQQLNKGSYSLDKKVLYDNNRVNIYCSPKTLYIGALKTHNYKDFVPFQFDVIAKIKKSLFIGSIPFFNPDLLCVI